MGINENELADTRPSLGPAAPLPGNGQHAPLAEQDRLQQCGQAIQQALAEFHCVLTVKITYTIDGNTAIANGQAQITLAERVQP